MCKCLLRKDSMVVVGKVLVLQQGQEGKEE